VTTILDGLEVRPSDGAVFGTRSGFLGGNLIVRVDPATGITTAVGSTGVGSPSDLAFRSIAGTGGTFGTFTLTFNGETTNAIPFNAFAALVDFELELLPSIGPNNVAVTGPNGGPWQVTFQNALGNQNVPSLSGASNEIQRVTQPIPQPDHAQLQWQRRRHCRQRDGRRRASGPRSSQQHRRRRYRGAGGIGVRGTSCSKGNSPM
jgi:hypothetical protein